MVQHNQRIIDIKPLFIKKNLVYNGDNGQDNGERWLFIMVDNGQ